MDHTSELLRQARAQGIVYIDSRIDYAFKLIFGTPGNEDLLLCLVQAILPDKGIILVSLVPQEQVGITDFIIPGVLANDDMINHYTIRNVKDNRIEFTDSIHYVTVELPKLTKTLAEVKDTSEWILYTIKNIGSMKEMPEEYRGSYLERFFELSKFAAMAEMSQREYLARYMWEVDQRSQLRSAREDGLAEGIAIGHAEGKAEGKAEGIIETARRMLADGMDPALVSKYSELSTEEISELLK